MSEFFENFGAKLPMSIHPRPYSVKTRERMGNKYGSLFYRGYREQEIDFEAAKRAVAEWVYSPIIFKTGYRVASDFVVSHWCVLDFDDPGYKLDQALSEWSDTVCIIGTTLNHQRMKSKRGCAPIACDRFRIIAPWARPIVDSYEYEKNMEFLVVKYDADEMCVDAARLFYPCREIVAVNTSGFLQEVREFKRPERIAVDEQQLAELRASTMTKGLPRWIDEFVNQGKMSAWEDFKGSRKWHVHKAAKKLLTLGWEYDAVSELLHGAKFDRHDFDKDEIDSAIASAEKKLKQRKENGAETTRQSAQELHHPRRGREGDPPSGTSSGHRQPAP